MAFAANSVTWRRGAAVTGPRRETKGEMTPTVSSAWVKGIIDSLERAGVDVRVILTEADIDAAAVEDPLARFRSERISILWERAAIYSGNPAIGLAMPRAPILSLYDAVGYAMMSSPNLLASAERLVRYLRVVSDAATVQLADGGAAGYRMSFALFGGGRPVPRQRVEFDVLSLLEFFRWVSGRKLRPRSVELAFPRPAELRPYEDAFECQLRFDAGVNCLVFKRSDLVEPLPTSSPALSQLHDRLAGDLLERLDDASMTRRVREQIVQMLPNGEPRRAALAKALGVSERTLQRRLADERAHLNVLIEGTRRELAQEYLANGRLSLAEVAYLLGFADQSNFFRSFKRWFATSPGEFRRRLREDPSRLRPPGPAPDYGPTQVGAVQGT